MGKNRKILTGLSLVFIGCIGAVYPLQAEEDVMVLGREGKSFNLSKKSDSPKEEEIAAAASATSSSVRVIGVWLVLGGIIAGAITLYYKRRTSHVLGGGKTHNMALIERLSLGNQREVLLLKACDRLLVVASQNGQLSLLTDMAAEESSSQPFPNLAANVSEAAAAPAPKRTETASVPEGWAATHAAMAAAATTTATIKPRQEFSQEVERAASQTISSAYAWPEFEGAAK